MTFRFSLSRIISTPCCAKLWSCGAEILFGANIEYIKPLGEAHGRKIANERERLERLAIRRWDMNRALTDAFSAALPSEIPAPMSSTMT